MKTMENARQSQHPRHMEETMENGKMKQWKSCLVLTAGDSSYLLSGRLARSNKTRQDWESLDWDDFESFDFECFDFESVDQKSSGKICVSFNDWQTN